MLSLITWAPLAGALIILMLPKEKVQTIQTVALAAAICRLAGDDRVVDRGTAAMSLSADMDSRSTSSTSWASTSRRWSC